MIDLEHSTMPLDVAAQLCATAGDLGLTPFVRVPEQDYGAIGRLLDGGAQGIIAPRIDTADQARAVAGHAASPRAASAPSWPRCRSSACGRSRRPR